MRSVPVAFLLYFLPVLNAAEFPTVTPVKVAGGFVRPTAIAAPRDGSGRIFITEQEGTIRILRDGVRVEQPFLNLKGRMRLPDPGCCDERGLLSTAFPPDFKASGRFYVLYTVPPDNDIRISRFKVSDDPDVADPGSEQVILTIPHFYENHFGGQLNFSPKNGKLYVSTGDGAGGGDPLKHGQNRESLYGKVFRLDAERDDFTPEIVAMGLRNPWRFNFDRLTGDLYIGDVGENSWEEVDLVPADASGVINFGWSILEGKHCLLPECGGASLEGLTDPIAEFSHDGGCSVTSGFVYRGSRFPALEGAYLYGDFCTGKIWGVRWVDGEWANRELAPEGELNPSAFGEDEAGEIYFTDYLKGDIYQVTAPVDAEPQKARPTTR